LGKSVNTVNKAVVGKKLNYHPNRTTSYTFVSRGLPDAKFNCFAINRCLWRKIYHELNEYIIHEIRDIIISLKEMV
jgi:hypothetical protein